MSEATVITVVHPAAQGEAFLAWSAQVDEAARGHPGCVSAHTSDPAAGTEWAVSQTFATEAQLHQWLDSAERTRLLADGQARGVWRKAADLVLTAGRPLPFGVAVIEHKVVAAKEAEFLASQRQLIALGAEFPGFEGACTLPHGEPGRWLAVLRFRTDHQLATWLESWQRAQMLPELRGNLTEEFAVAARSTPFGSILRVSDGETTVTPNWKTAMLVLLVLYPTVMILSRFLGPLLDQLGAEPWLALWLSQIVSVGVMTWYLMPVVTGWFRRWLDPVDGSGLRVSLIGVAVVLLTYAATLLLFASVRWLQFWDYAD